MYIKRCALFLLLIMAVLPTHDLYAAVQPSRPSANSVITHGMVVIHGVTIHYTARAGTLILRNALQVPIASVFYVAYWKDGVRNAANRPITFAYNGGPGSSSVWLQMGGIGPRRVMVPSDAKSVPPPPYDISNNPYSILDKSDVVFIDPVGTGYSHPLGKATGKQFWGVDQDVHSMGEFIIDYVSRFNRWNSPKFLLGESYGTFRTAVLINYLQNQGMQFNGVILLSSVLNFEASSFQPGNDLPYILFLPSYAAIAWYHHALSPEPKNLTAFLGRVEKFAVSDYSIALLQGDSLSINQEDKIVAKLSEYTGLSQSYWRKADLRVNADEFETALLSHQSLVIGRLDARYTDYAVNPLLPFREYPVMASAIDGAFTAAVNYYIRNDLHYVSPRPYLIMNRNVNRHWDWKHKLPFRNFGARPGFTNAVPDLRRAMITNPHLQLMVNSGYFDLGTPYFATQYTINELKLPNKLKNHLHTYHYYVGHMLYLNTPSLAALHHNLDRFIDISVRQKK